MWNDLAWNDLTMEQSDRIPFSVSVLFLFRFFLPQKSPAHLCTTSRLSC